MAEILFTHSYFLRFDPKQWKQQQPYPPLGTLYAAAYLRASGRSVALCDTMFAHGPQEIQPWLDREQPAFLVIFDDGFNYLTKMCLTNMRHAAWDMQQMARSRGACVIVCSSDSTDHYEKYLDHGADFVILGEGEEALLELVNAVRAGATDFRSIPGVAFRAEGTTVVNPRRPVMKDLDSLPTAAWDLLDITPYKAAWAQHGYFSLNLATTRGCPYKCNWCAKPIYGNRYNSHSPARSAADLALVRSLFQPDHIWYGDDIFGLKPGWVQEFAAEVHRLGVHTPFKIQSRVDLLLQDDTIEALARAGCTEIWVGAESGSQGILDAMDKGTTVAQIRTARAKLKQHGIRTAFFLQFGYLGETRTDIEATFRMLAETLPDDIGVSVSYPLPGTPFYERVRAELGDKTNWTDSDELALMFRNTYSPAFYKRLHRYVHKYFRRLQGQESLGRLLRLKPETGDLKRALRLGWYVPAAAWEWQRLRGLFQENKA